MGDPCLPSPPEVAAKQKSAFCTMKCFTVFPSCKGNVLKQDASSAGKSNRLCNTAFCRLCTDDAIVAQRSKLNGMN